VRRDGGYTKVRKTFSGDGAFEAAKAWRADAAVAARTGSLVRSRPDRRTLAEALNEWLDDLDADRVRPRGRPAYKPATKRGYRQHTELYLKASRLGSMRVVEIQRADVQALCDELLSAGLAPGTVANILCPLQAFYRRLEQRGAVTVNPATRLDLPAPGKRRPKRVASPQEAAKLIDALPVADRPLWATAFYAGLRRGELQALRWRDVDLGRGMIRVERSWDQYEGANATKSEASRRVVPLLAALRDHLDEHKLRSAAEADALVFGRSSTVAFAPISVDKRAKAAWRMADLASVTLHECRHTFASLLIDAGTNPKAIQTYMGHSKIQTTFDIYGHLMPGNIDDVRERMDAYLVASSESQPVG
jgi:integrase